MTKKELAIIDGVRLERDRLDELLTESKRLESDLQISKAAMLVDLHRANQRIACSSSEREQLAARVKTLEDALRLAADMNDCGASYVAQKALAAKGSK